MYFISPDTVNYRIQSAPFLKTYSSILDHANAHIDKDKEEVTSIYLCI